MKTTLMRGVPASLRMDAWWMSGGNAESARPPSREASNGQDRARRPQARVAVLLALVLLADWLFWAQGVGVSLVMFAGALVAGMLVVADGRVGAREGMAGGVILLLGLLPVLIYVQMLSVAFYGATLLGIASWFALKGRGNVRDILRASLRFLALAPMQTALDIKAAPREVYGQRDWDGMTRNLLRAWALPGVVGGAFLLLFLQGNPVLEQMASRLLNVDADMDRLLFWVLMGAAIWPFLVLYKMRQRLMLPFSLPHTPRIVAPSLLNPESVTNSLVLFNLMFTVQTGLDLVYLWGGASLPDGMSLATYAHRGAYPLVATALLAGVFALISRPYVQNRPVLRGLLLLWLVQNLALVAGAIERLDLYVEAFGLTYLRVAAYIWMGMVAVGLVLVGWQVLRSKGNGWLLVRMSTLLVAVLYVCSFVNFANLIAANNLGRSQKVEVFLKTDTGSIRTDAWYICSLGPMALPAIVDFENRTGQRVCEYGTMPQLQESGNWREWGFRRWRVQRYLAVSGAAKDVL